MIVACAAESIHRVGTTKLKSVAQSSQNSDVFMTTCCAAPVPFVGHFDSMCGSESFELLPYNI
jgi:hypothetical protein